MTEDAHDPAMSALAGLALLGVRGVLLWAVVPLATLAWLIGFPVTHRINLGQFLGWVDLQLIAGLQNTVFAWGTHRYVNAPPWRDAASVTHRIGILNPV